MEGQWAPHITVFNRDADLELTVCGVAGRPGAGAGRPATQVFWDLPCNLENFLVVYLVNLVAGRPTRYADFCIKQMAS